MTSPRKDDYNTPDSQASQEIVIVSKKQLGDDTPIKRTRKAYVASMSPAQIKAADTEAERLGMNRSEFIRYLLAQAIDNFPDDLMAHGEGLNK